MMWGEVRTGSAKGGFGPVQLISDLQTSNSSILGIPKDRQSRKSPIQVHPLPPKPINNSIHLSPPPKKKHRKMQAIIAEVNPKPIYYLKPSYYKNIPRP